MEQREEEDCDFTNDSDYQSWIEKAVKLCRCCPLCQDSPCAGVLAGGFCDGFECECDRDEWDGPDYDEEEYG